MNELLHAPQGYRVLDYGAGRGQGWPDLLTIRPDMELLAFEPDRRSKSDLVRRLAGTRAIVLDDRSCSFGELDVDCVVSFSVFEHVADRRQYLENARRAMKKTSIFVLNYDDGHFRPILNLGDTEGLLKSIGTLKETVGNLFWPLLARLGYVNHFQARVHRTAADRLVRDAGFVVESQRYENITCLKELAKFMPQHQKESFHRCWLELEDRLNTEFSTPANPRFGDAEALWQVMPTRTLRLRRSHDT